MHLCLKFGLWIHHFPIHHIIYADRHILLNSPLAFGISMILGFVKSRDVYQPNSKTIFIEAYVNLMGFMPTHLFIKLAYLIFADRKHLIYVPSITLFYANWFNKNFSDFELFAVVWNIHWLSKCRATQICVLKTQRFTLFMTSMWIWKRNKEKDHWTNRFVL